MADDLMLGDSGLSKTEREMIAVAVSAVNHCHYCLTSHGAALRQRGKDPELGELIAQNYRAAELDRRQKAMLDFATRLTEAPDKIEETDREALRKAGFSDRDIWDIAAVASFYNMSNRMAAAADIRPNTEYHYLGAGAQRRGAARRARAPASVPRPPTSAHRGGDGPRRIANVQDLTLKAAPGVATLGGHINARPTILSGRTDWCGACAIQSRS